MVKRRARGSGKAKPAALQSQGSPSKEGAGEAAGRAERFVVEIYRAWCKACGICVAFCPQEVLSLNDAGGPEVVSPELCTGCGWCELRCPDFAISVKQRRKEVCEA